MTISGRLEDNVLILDVNGRIDTDHAEEADQKIEELQEKYPAEHMVIDAAGLEYIASAGLRVVLQYARQDKKLRIINTSEAVYNIFYITGFTDIMNIEKLDNAHALAADMNSNQRIDIFDYIIIRKIIMEEQ